MTKWNLPEGRKPLTDADMADLTRRLADTSIEQSELYQAAKRDAEEAEAKLAKVSVFLRFLDRNYSHVFGDVARQNTRKLYAELQGEKDE